jgi:homoserine/homoserine lactone efflux protein
MTVEAWLAFCVMATVLCFTPGPAVLFVVSVALTRGFRPGLAAAAGICAANVLYFVLSATGIAAVILASSALFEVLKTAGAVYLVWLGLGMILARRTVPVAPTPRHDRHAFLRAFVVQGANPNALIFFVAFVPQFIDPAGSMVTQIVILGVSTVLIELAVLALYVAVAVRARRLAGARLAGPLERVGGAFLVAAGARLAVVGAR